MNARTIKGRIALLLAGAVLFGLVPINQGWGAPNPAAYDARFSLPVGLIAAILQPGEEEGKLREISVTAGDGVLHVRGRLRGLVGPFSADIEVAPVAGEPTAVDFVLRRVEVRRITVTRLCSHLVRRLQRKNSEALIPYVAVLETWGERRSSADDEKKERVCVIRVRPAAELLGTLGAGLRWIHVEITAGFIDLRLGLLNHR